MELDIAHVLEWQLTKTPLHLFVVVETHLDFACEHREPDYMHIDALFLLELHMINCWLLFVYVLV